MLFYKYREALEKVFDRNNKPLLKKVPNLTKQYQIFILNLLV